MASASNVQVYDCILCEEGKFTEAQMKSHMLIKHTDTGVICPFCDLSDITPQEMSLHVNSVHLDANSPTEKVTSQNKTSSKEKSSSPTNRKSPSVNNQRKHGEIKKAKSPPTSVNNQRKHGEIKKAKSPPTTQAENSIGSKLFNQPKHRSDGGFKNKDQTSSPNKNFIVTNDKGEVFENNKQEHEDDSVMDYSNASSSSLFSNVSPSVTRTDESFESSDHLLNSKYEQNSVASKTGDPSTKSESCSTQDHKNKNSVCSSSLSLESMQKNIQYQKISNVMKSESPSRSSISNIDRKSSVMKYNNISNVKPISGCETVERMDALINCPLCSFNTDCADVLTVHVNQAHFPDTPQKSNYKNSMSLGTNDKNDHIKQNERTAAEAEQKPFQQPETNDLVALTLPEASADCRKSNSFTPVKREPDHKKQCPFCDLEVEEEVTLQFHINGSHAGEISNNATHDDELLECPVCGEIFGFGTEEAGLLQAHVNSHFIVQKEASVTNMTDLQMAQELQRREEQARKYKQQKKQDNLKAKDNRTIAESYKKTAVKNMEKEVSRGQMSITDFYTRRQDILQANSTGVDEGTSCTKDVIPQIQQYYRRPNKFLASHWLCSLTDHYSGSYGDRGWGCGYRNLQMLLSCLAKIPQYQQVVFNGFPKIPSIPKLQSLIEDSWSQGFDPQGREQLKKVVGTSKWIGATEIYSVLSSLKVKCQLIDFHCSTGKDGTHPRLFKWVKDYFCSDREYKPPLYLQHQGHSRTIIGIEEYKDGGQKLLIYDPGTPKGQMLKFTRGQVDNNIMKTIRRTLYGLKAKQYQIVAVIGTLSDGEKQRYKLVKSDRVP